MLYNPKWEPSKRDIFSTASLIAWLETKDPNTQYEYCVPSQCALAQYFRSTGEYHFVSVGTDRVTLGKLHGDKRYPLPRGWNKIAVAHPFTFGDMLKRARSLENRSLLQKVLEFFGR